MNDISKFAGWYLIIIGCIEIALTSYNTSSLYLNMTSIIAGYFIMKRNNKARIIVSVVLGILILINVLFIVYYSISGMPLSFSLTYFGYKPIITNMTDLYLWTGTTIIILFIPFLLLRSKKAIKEYEGEVVTV